MYQQQPMNAGFGLPVPSSPINQQFWVQSNLPYQVPFVPAVQVAPEMQNYLPLITGHSILAIQQGAQRNELRSFYFNLCSANAWQNRDFADHVTGVAQLAHLLIVSNRLVPEQAVGQAAQMMTDMLVSQQAVKYENYFARYMTPEMVHSVRENMGRFQAAQAQIQQLYGGGMGGGYLGGYGNSAPMGRGPTFVGAPGNYGAPPPPNSGGYPNRFAAPSHTTTLDQLFRDDRGTPNNTPVNDGFGRTYGAATSTNRPVEEITMSPGSGVEHKAPKFPPAFGTSDASRGVQPAVAPKQPEVKRMPPPTHVPISSDREWPKVYDPTRPYDSMIMEGGEEIRPAYTSGWTTTYSIENPYPLVYRLSDQMLFHVRNTDGHINELVLERNETMGYLDNELDPKLRAAVKAAAANPNIITALNWKGAAMIQQVDGKPFTQPLEIAEEGNFEVEVEAFPITDETVIQAHSLAEANVKLTMACSNAGITRDDSKSLEYYVDLLTPVAVSQAEVRRAVTSLKSCTSLTTMVEKLVEFRDKLPTDLFATIDKRLTDRLNHVIDKSLGLQGWNIDSFFDDLNELLALIRNDYGDTLVDALQDNYRDVVGPAVEVLASNGLSRYLESIGSEETSPDKSNLLVFRDRVSVLNVPWSYDDMALEIRDGGLVTQTRLPEVYAVLEAVFHRTRASHIPFAHHYLVTKDQKRLEFRRGFLGRNSIVVYPA